MQVLKKEDVQNMMRLFVNKHNDEWFPISKWKSGDEECTTFCQYSSKYDDIHIASCKSENLRDDLQLR